MSVEGTVDTQIFDAFVEHFLIPTLHAGDIVVLDNESSLLDACDWLD